MYTSPIRVDEENKYPPNVRAKLNLSGLDKFLTRIVLVDSEGRSEEGFGWEFVEPRLGDSKWRAHRARMVVEARRIWIVNRRFGLTFTITDLAIREEAATRPNPFAADSTLEVLAGS